MKIILLLISLGASTIGAICGIGGGIIIKPLLDFTAIVSLSAAGFYSSFTVLGMSAYNVNRSLADKSGGIDRQVGTPLAIGAAVGGIVGNRLFTLLKTCTGQDGVVGALQSIMLLVLTLGTLLYTLKKSNINPKCVGGCGSCLAIGAALGCVSSFLGIGGGPFNLAVLHYFFGMDTKKAVSNSLYIILFSQAANLLMYFISGSVPQVDIVSLLLMIIGGISGGIIGRTFNKRNSAKTIDKLFVGLMAVIMLLCVYNALKYLSIVP